MDAVFNPPLANISVNATSGAGATVTFDVTADKGGVPVPVTCTPASGFLFPIGDTTVTCTASFTTGTFVVGCLAWGLGGGLRRCREGEGGHVLARLPGQSISVLS